MRLCGFGVFLSIFPKRTIDLLQIAIMFIQSILLTFYLFSININIIQCEPESPDESVVETCNEPLKCGVPPMDVPRCADGRLRDVRCERPVDSIHCKWTLQESCVGDEPMARLNPIVSDKPVVAIVMTGQLGRVVVKSKIDRLLHASNRADFNIAVIAVLSNSPTTYRKSFQMSLDGDSVRQWHAIFDGDIRQLFAQFSAVPNVDLLFYAFPQREVSARQLPVTREMRMLSFAADKDNSTRAHLSQFDGMRRVMALVRRYEQLIGKSVDYVLRVRDDEHFLADVSFESSVTALGRSFDMLNNYCGAYSGINDHTYFFKRDSPAFDAVRLGQLLHAYEAVRPPLWARQNPEYLLRTATDTYNVRVGLVAPCHFSSVCLRNSTSVGPCIDWSSWFANIAISERTKQHCRPYPNFPMLRALRTCQTAANPRGRVVLPTEPRCPEPSVNGQQQQPEPQS